MVAVCLFTNATCCGSYAAEICLNRVEVAGCEAFARTLPVMQHLKQLSLSQTQLTDSNLDIMLNILKVSCTLPVP